MLKLMVTETHCNLGESVFIIPENSSRNRDHMQILYQFLKSYERSKICISGIIYSSE